MFEGLVASILNKWLGKYVEDLDTERLNVGIFSGEVRLCNLSLKPEALYELELPIEVKYGLIGTIDLTIPWTNLSSQAIIINVEDVLVVCSPIHAQQFSSEKEKKLIRAFKNKVIEDLEDENFLGCGSGSLLDGLLTALKNTIQICIRKIHIRYEDQLCGNGINCGLCIESLSLETTNSKWKPGSQPAGNSTVYQLAKLEAASAYFNTKETNMVFLDEDWRQELIDGLKAFRIKGKPFDFVIKPFNAKMKTIVSRSSETRVPKLLADLVIHDIVCSLSRAQLHSIIALFQTFHLINLRREFLSFRPYCKVHGNISVWWKYFCKAVLQQRVRPYKWEKIRNHRSFYHEYKSLYKKAVLSPGDTELRLSLACVGDNLSLSNIIIAREHGKIELRTQEPNRIEVVSDEDKWWKLHGSHTLKFQVKPDKPRGIWSQLSQSERDNFNSFGKFNMETSPEKAKKYIEHKINITVHHVSGNLYIRGEEIASLSINQLLCSFETRPAGNAFKVSARAESILLEGASRDQGLVPLVTTYPTTGNPSSNFLYIDFEKNPLAVKADYGITVNLEQHEIIYHEYAFSEFLNFFQGVGITQNFLKLYLVHLWRKADKIKKLIESRHVVVNFNMCLKAPHFVIAEGGLFQKLGMVTVLNLGKWTLHTDLQPPLCLEDVTQMELEERLYDRLYINLDGLQLLFSNSGENWRESLKQDDSEYHILSKVRGQVVLSTTIKPDYKLLPKSKLNMILYNAKINLSDRRLITLLDFIEGLPLPSSNVVSVNEGIYETLDKNDVIKSDVELNLKYIKNLVVASELSRQRTPDNSECHPPSLGALDWSSVEVSDEDIELWARTVDLPGFDDNVSPNNIITSLLRIVIGEVVVILSRSSDMVDKPYLMARISKCRLDLAFMNYGPAIQATLGGIQLIDKLHIGSTGEYLEIISTQSDIDFITLLYRKVRSDCPDFKKHFHSVEQSLVLDFGVLAFTMHREATLTLIKYLQYLCQKVTNREIFAVSKNINYLKSFFKKLETYDPPIPPGAIKFSYSIHLTEFRLRLCDSELEFVELKIKEFESDCIFKANERMTLRANLSLISLDDLSTLTLYPKLISIDEDRVFELKYTRHSPRICDNGLNSPRNTIHTDGSLKVTLERIQIVFVYKLLVDLQHFIEPIVPIGVIWQITNFLRRSLSSQMNQLRGWNTRLNLSLHLHLPILLIPQKLVSPNLLVVNLSELSVENFFKELPNGNTNEEPSSFIDNILIKIESASLSRASMSLTGNLKIQEHILEPIHAKFDVKRFVGGPTAMVKVGSVGKFREIPLFEIAGNLESIRISFGQKDLFTFLSVWRDNFKDRKFLESSWWWKSVSPIDGRTPTENDEFFVRKLQVFLSHSDACRKDTTARLFIDSITVDLYNDIGEILSSPVRDVNTGLCRLTLTEASLFLEKYYDGSTEMKLALQTCLLEDTRTDPSIYVKRVFQSHLGSYNKMDSTISVSAPPIVDITFKQTQTGDRCIDILVEKTRLNLSVSFVSAFAKFAMDSIPERKKEGGFINHGYIGDFGQGKNEVKMFHPPPSIDSTSGYYSSGMSCATDEQCGLSVSLRFRQPELVIFTTAYPRTSAILFRCELLLDWSKHPGRDAFIVSLADLQAWSKNHSNSTLTKQTVSKVLNQCDLEIARNLRSQDDATKITVTVSPVDLRLSVLTIATIGEIIQEIRETDFMDYRKNSNNLSEVVYDLQDLWSPKKIASHCEADICSATEMLIIQQPSFPVGKPVQSITVDVPKIKVFLEDYQRNRKRSLFLVRISFKLVAYDWSSSINLKGELQIQAAYFNEDVCAWEPFIEPCNKGVNVNKPWELSFQVFQGKSFPISPHDNFQGKNFKVSKRKVSNHTEEPEESQTSGDDSDCGMIFLKRQNFSHHEINKQNFSLSCGDSSDSENEDEALEKLTNAVGHLFTDENDDEEESDSEDTSAAENEVVEEPEVETEDETCSARSTGEERAVFLKKHSDSIDSGLNVEAVERFAVHILLHTKDRLEMSISPSSLKVLQEIFKVFSHSSTMSFSNLVSSDTLKNSLGPGSVITILSKSKISGKEEVQFVSNYDKDDYLSNSSGSLRSTPSPATSDSELDFESCEKEVHNEKLSPVFQYPKDSVTQLYDRITEKKIHIQIPGFNDLNVVAPNISGDKIHVLQPNRNQMRYHVVISTVNQNNCKTFVVRSPLQIRNETTYAIGIYYKKSVINKLGEKILGEETNPFDDFVRLTVIEPDDTFDVPLFIAYHCKLFIVPTQISTYQISDNGFYWQDMMSDLRSKDLICLSKQKNDSTVFSVKANCEAKNKMFNCPSLLPNYMIHILPPLVVCNSLPYAIEIKMPHINCEVRIEVGHKMNIYFLSSQEPQKIIIEIPEYLGSRWMGSFNLVNEMEEKTLTMMTERDADSSNKQLSINLLISRSPSVNIQVYSSYWIVNKTSLPLQIRSSLTDCIHEFSGETPLLFGFRKQKRRCVRLRAFTSSWSSAFSLDTTECSGLVLCKDKERKRRYRILMVSKVSAICPKLTKIINFLPNFTVTNSSKKHLRFMEDNDKADLWIDIAPAQCLSFWPETDSMKMFVKFRDSKHISQPFPVTITHTTVLRMDKGCGMTVQVTAAVDKPFSIVFQNYKPGDAPVRIDNQCEDLFLKFHQKESGQVVLISPYHSVLYTWDDPSKERSLLWNVYNNKGKDFCVPFWKDGFGEEKVSFHVVRRGQPGGLNESVTSKLSVGLKRLNGRSSVAENNSSSSDDSEEDGEKPQLAKKTRRDKIIVYWASYLDGRQRVLVLTQDERIAKRIKNVLDAERSHLELCISLAGVGLSLVNKNELGIPRELAYYSLSDSAALWEVTVAHRWKVIALELASWLEEKYKQGVNKAQIKDYIHIDFEKMQMTKPFFGELRRKHRPAVWIQYRRSSHLSLLHLQIHRLQIDNQLHGAEFPTILHLVSPSLVSSKSNLKPAVEIAFLKKYTYNSDDVYKFVKFIIQEHKLQIDRLWLLEMCNFFANWYQEESFSGKVCRDLALVHMPISSWIAKSSDGEREYMFEYLHCSPVKLQIAFSSQEQPDVKESHCNPLIDYFLYNLAPSLFHVKSITVKLLCFEIIGQLCNKDFIWDQAIHHFKSQLWQQLHVLVIGDNVLTNPYSQFIDLSDDSHPLFYEPHLENTGVPEEFSEGISSGVLGLLGHETGSSHGATTLFAALLGTTLQSIIQNGEPKKKYPSVEIDHGFPESVMQLFSNFSAVCPLALSGVVMKANSSPLQNVENFFKGPGKGLMGLVTKSTTGVFDCFSMVTDGLKRAIEMGENVISRVRPPRYINPFLGLRPYCSYEAIGLALQKIVCREPYNNDIYWCHAVLGLDSKITLLVTLQHIFLVGKYKCWGSYEIIWMLRMDDLITVPSLQDGKLIFRVRQEEVSDSDWNKDKSITSSDKQLLQWLKNQIETVMILSIEDKPCL